MPNATVIHLPIRVPDGIQLVKAAREIRDATADSCNYALVISDYWKNLSAGMKPVDATAQTVADALHATLNWPDEERRRYAESLEREVGRER